MKENIIFEKLSSGDKVSFENLVNLYEKRIYGYVYNMIHNPTMAEDITQENFEVRNIIMSEIGGFKPDVKMILLLRIMDDLSFEEIGLTVGKTTSAVKLKFYRNRKILVEKLNYILKEG